MASEHVFVRVIRTFDSDYGDVLSNMKRHLDSIAPATQLAAVEQSRDQYKGKQKSLCIVPRIH